LILSTNMLQEIEVISDEKQRTKKEAVWKQWLIQFTTNASLWALFHHKIKSWA
jgi:hypothetical protein